MDEDILSPLLGRLIDEAKAAALTGVATPAEGVALLLADDTVVSAAGSARAAGGEASAVQAALAKVAADRLPELAAAAVAGGDATAESMLPSEASRRALGAISADLPLVIKRRGRWIVKPLSQVPPAG